MINDKLKTKGWDYLLDDFLDLDDSFKYPVFKKGDVVWVLGDSQYYPDRYDRYGFKQMVVANGEPLDDDREGWGYIIDDVHDFLVDREYNDKDYSHTPQIHMFTKLKDLKEHAKKKVNKRIKDLERQIENIDSFRDDQEYRDEQIDSVIDD